MTPLRTLAAACLAALLVTACTGTSEPRPPTLLIVGVEQAGTPQLLLIEDVTATAPPGSPRLVVVPGSARSLQAPAVDLDFENRGAAREALWLLTRAVAGPAGSAEVAAYLQRFATEDIDPQAPGGFAEDVGARIALTLPGGGGLLDGLSLTSPETCPTTLQVTRDGALAAVLDDPQACGLTGHPELWLVDTDAVTARSLAATDELLAAGIYLDQRPEDQRLYFLVDAITNTHVYIDELDGSPAGRLSQASLPRRGPDLIDLAGSGDALIALTANELVSLDLTRPAVAATVSSTPATARAVVLDPVGTAPDALVLGATRAALHGDLADTDPDTTGFTVVAATVDPVIFFAYGVAQERVVIFDLLTGGGSGEPLRVHAEQLSGLTLPDGGVNLPEGLSVIAWVRAIAPPGP